MRCFGRYGHQTALRRYARHRLGHAVRTGRLHALLLLRCRRTRDARGRLCSGRQTRNCAGIVKVRRSKVREGQRHHKLLRHAQKISQTTAMPAIHLARMGVDGSSGSHRNRKTQLALQATNLALDAIKRRYGFHGFDIFGQSGGSTVTAGLLSVRHDIGCAVLGSGQLSGHRGHCRWMDQTIRCRAQYFGADLGRDRPQRPSGGQGEAGRLRSTLEGRWPASCAILCHGRRRAPSQHITPLAVCHDPVPARSRRPGNRRAFAEIHGRRHQACAIT